MTAFITHLDNIISVDWPTIIVISVLCAIAGYFVKEYLAHPPLIIFVFPIMVFCGLATYYLLVVWEQFSVKKIDQWLMWTILAAISGTVVGIGIVTILATVRERLGTSNTPVARTTRSPRQGSAIR